MKINIVLILDWVLLLVFCAFIFSTSDVLPGLWAIWKFFAGDSMEYIPTLFVSSIQFCLLFYLVVVNKQKRYSSYLWFLNLTALMGIVYNNIENPYEKMHLFEYFFLSFLLFRVLHHHIGGKKLYLIGALLAMAVALTDEYMQSFLASRHFSLPDLRADFISAILGQVSIALIFKPRLEVWKAKLNTKRAFLHRQDRWLKEKSKRY